MKTLKHTSLSLFLFLSLNNISFAQGDFTYVLSLNEYSCPTNRGAMEARNKYYVPTDIGLPNSDNEYLCLLTVYDESMNPLKTIRLHEPEERIIPIYFFYDNTSFYAMGYNALSDRRVAHPFFIQYDTNFKPLHEPIVYAFEDSITDYAIYGVIQNAENEFIYLLMGYYFDSLFHPTGRLLRVDKTGNLLEDVLFPFGGNPGASIAEHGNYYYIDRAEKDFLLRCSKNALGIMDTLYFTPHQDDYLAEGTMIIVGDQLLRTATAFVYHDECGNPPPWEADRSITFLDTAMNTRNRITVGDPCINEANWGGSMDYINPDSIFYVYASDVGGLAHQNICVTNFRQDGTINYHHTIVTGEISRKTIYGCRALSDGGVLIFGEMCDFIDNGICGGFVLKYHPYMNDLPRPYINYYNYVSTTGIETLPVSAEVNVYPNPAQQTLYIQSSQEIERISVYDISGRELLTKTESALFGQSIDVSGLANGIYLVKVKTKAGETVKKIVKQ